MYFFSLRWVLVFGVARIASVNQNGFFIASRARARVVGAVSISCEFKAQSSTATQSLNEMDQGERTLNMDLPKAVIKICSTQVPRRSQ